MRIQNEAHLSYCTNIHSGESWPEVFSSLQYTLAVKNLLQLDEKFGIGLRLSALASQQLAESSNLEEFKFWLEANDCYVYTMNGFPYGGFHRTIVKDQVHSPDWTTIERLEYTRLLFSQLSSLLPEGIEGSISTSPLSYKYWHKTDKALEEVKNKSMQLLIRLVSFLVNIEKEYGKLLHLDIEPEPDGVLENSQEFITFYHEYLLLKGVPLLVKMNGMSRVKAESAIRNHIRLCYDVCHFAIAYESPEVVMKSMDENGIGIGKIQISAALKSHLNPVNINQVKEGLLPYNESTYLHQTVFRKDNAELVKFPDLGDALKMIHEEEYRELRTHFHVPIFTETYGELKSTNDEILKVFHQWKKRPQCKHFEVETYTWEVLPQRNKLKLAESISRELEWVLKSIA